MVEFSPQELALIKRVNINPNHVGDVIAEGSQKRVRALLEPGSPPMVLKVLRSQYSNNVFDIVSSCIGGQDLAGARRDHELVEEYFSEYAIPFTIKVADGEREFVFQDELIE